MRSDPAPTRTAPEQAFALEDMNWGALLVGIGLSIILHSMLHDLGQKIPALQVIPGIAWPLLAVPAGMLVTHHLALLRKRIHGLLVAPAFLILTVTGNLLTA